MYRAATKIQAVYRGWELRCYLGLFDNPHLNERLLLLRSLRRGWAEAWTACDMEYYANCLTHGRCCVPFYRVQVDGPDNNVGKQFGCKDVLKLPMIKWLLRYDREQYYRLADLSNSWSLVLAIHNHQARRLCAVSQVLSANGVPREVFDTHCGGLDIAGIRRATDPPMCA
jgi:hypothetical protein